MDVLTLFRPKRREKPDQLRSNLGRPIHEGHQRLPGLGIDSEADVIDRQIDSLLFGGSHETECTWSGMPKSQAALPEGSAILGTFAPLVDRRT
jgi:hypothetical protein